MYKVDKDLLAIQEARIHIEAAKEAAIELRDFSQNQLDDIVDQMAAAMIPHCQELAESAVVETAYGRCQDKALKNRFSCEFLSKKLSGKQYVGVIAEDKHNQTLEIGVPIGVVVSLIPATSPVSTTIHNVLIAIKSGNSIIISPHPRAKQTIQQTVKLLKEAALLAGLPDGGINCMQLVSTTSTDALLSHEETALTIVTGIPKLLPKLYQMGKPFIYGGSGNGPVFIERTCDLKQAIHDVVESRTFDHGIVSAAEQSIVLDGPISERAKDEFNQQGAHFLGEAEAQRLLGVLVKANGELNAESVGCSAQELAKRAMIEVAKETRIFIYEQDYVSDHNPFSQEFFSPIVALFVEPNWQEACEKCIELLMEGGKSHTLVIHSKDEQVIREFAMKKPVARVLVNTPSTLGGMGATTNLFPSMTLGSTSLGIVQGSDNISPEHLVRIRKVGYGVRRFEECFPSQRENHSVTTNEGNTQPSIEVILRQIINEIKE